MSSFNFSTSFQHAARGCLLGLSVLAATVHAEAWQPDSLEFAAILAEAKPDASQKSGKSAPASAKDPVATDDYYEMLVGEMALTRRNFSLAATAYQDLARRTLKEDIIERAIQISHAANDYEGALELLALWKANGNPDPVRFAVAQTEILIGAGRILELEEPLTFLLERHPEQREGNFLMIMKRLGRNNDAAASYALMSRLAMRYPKSAAAQVVLAVTADQAGEKAAARQAILRAHELKPDWELPLLMQSDWLARDISGKQSVAPEEIEAHLARLEKFLKASPDNSSIRMQLARLLILAGKEPALAHKHFDRLLVERPDNPAILYSAAMLAIQSNDMESARQVLNHILTMPVSGDMAHFLLGQVEETSGNKALAAQYYERVPYGSSSYFSARARLAWMLAKDDLASARRAILASEVRGPEETMWRKQAEAHLFCENGQNAECYTVLVSALKEFPDNPELLLYAAITADKLQRWTEMEKHLRHMMQAHPENAEAYNALGYSLADRNLRLPEAYTLIAKARALAPDSPHILDSYGWVLYRQGKLPEALAALEEAYAKMNDPEVAAHLGEVLWKLGRRDEAMTIWQKEREKSPDHVVLKETLQRFAP
ncbi:MAG: tetratricopeptide repeat protein [Zoogloeaceae bacterium]|nr:tetratricopeptide repeat protein [Zoogloeaceae bacterium]